MRESASQALVDRRVARWLATAAAGVGVVAWAAFYRAGLVLSHYDAKAHLVVARRVIDNLTPGWQQIGAVWLPLPHLVELLPTQIDVFYRTGVFASFVSIACLALTTYAAARLILRITGSAVGSATAAALIVLNPNLLYLHTTPMTEPMLLAASMLALLWLYEWVEDDRDTIPVALGLALFAAVWTRYEAWPVIGAALILAVYATWRRRGSAVNLFRRTARLAIWPAAAIAIFLVNSRFTVGSWFVSDGFYVPDPTYEGQALRTAIGIWWGTHQLGGYVVEIVGVTAAVAIAWLGLVRRERSGLLITLSLFAAAAVPIVAFYDGHPYRIRYMIPTTAACALFAGLAVGLVSQVWERVRLSRVLTSAKAGMALAVLLVATLFLESPPWDRQAPMLLEAQWDRGASMGRRSVTTCLARDYRGEKIMASMGSLAHYMQELSSSGFAIADFINEGNGVIWNMALQTGPAPHAGWMLVEEIAEGGDVLAERVRRDPTFAHDMTRVCEGGGVALYRREDVQHVTSSAHLPNLNPTVP